MLMSNKVVYKQDEQHKGFHSISIPIGKNLVEGMVILEPCKKEVSFGSFTEYRHSGFRWRAGKGFPILEAVFGILWVNGVPHHRGSQITIGPIEQANLFCNEPSGFYIRCVQKLD